MAREQEPRQPPLPDDGREELSRVDVGDREASGCGELSHNGQHSAHYGQIWWRTLVSHMEGRRSHHLGPAPCPVHPDSTPLLYPNPREALPPEREATGHR